MFSNYFKRLGRAFCGLDNEVQDLSDFNQKFDILDYDHPGLMTPRLQEERWRYLNEEATEFREAMTLEDQADALIDIVYIAKGTARMMGLPWEKLWDDVQRANMAKVKKATERSTSDITKPPGWEPPMGWQILSWNGWDGAREDTWINLPTSMLREHDSIKTRNIKEAVAS